MERLGVVTSQFDGRSLGIFSYGFPGPMDWNGAPEANHIDRYRFV